MGLTLNFKVVPASPYHTLNFHMKRGIKQKFYEQGSEGKGWVSFLPELADALRILNHIPDDFSVCILPSKIYAGAILQNLFPPVLHLSPAHPSINHRVSAGLIDSGFKGKILSLEILRPHLNGIKNGGILSHDVDLISGYSLNLPELFSVHEEIPDVFLCLDISTSIANHPYDYEKVDAYLFNSEFVFGMQPGITVLVLPDPFIKLVRQKWTVEFYSPVLNADHDHQGILCHREIDPLKLFAFKEMCNDLVRRDRKIIRNEIIYKSILISNALDSSETFELMVKNESDRSPNIISARILGPVEKIRNHLRDSGIQMDEIYEENYGPIIRFGNFPVHSKEQAEYLSDSIASLT